MAESASPKPAPRNQINRTAIGFNVSVQVILILVIIAFVNTMSYRHYERWDFSHDHNYELSDKTKTLLGHLDQPMRAIVYLTTAQATLNKDVAGLLREYDEASKKKFTTEFVDPYKNVTRARELAARYSFKDSENIVILDYNGRHKVVQWYEMGTFKRSEEPGLPPSMTEFKGEEAITSALQGLLEEKQKKLYVIGGHGELSLDADDTRLLTERIKRENIDFAPLNLGNVEAVPADASGVMIFGPWVDYSEREIQMLHEYWIHHKGRFLILLKPDGTTPRLDQWLTEQGVKPQGDRILRTGAITADGATQNGIWISPQVIYAEDGRKVTKELAGIQPTFLGFTESLLVDENFARTQKLNVIGLVISSSDYWGETEYVTGSNQPVYFDPKKDHQGPLIVGVAMERGAIGDERVKVDTSRMIIVGNAGFVTDRGMSLSPTGDVFGVAALNWIFSRELVSGIPPKRKDSRALGVTPKQLSSIFWTSVVCVPLGAGLLGLYVTWFRRNRSLLTLTVWVVGIGLFIVGSGWSLNLFFESRESALNPVALKDYAIPAMLALVPLLVFLMHVTRKPLEFPVHRDSV